MKNTLMMAMAGIVTLGGCVASTTPETDARFGESMTLIRAQQTLNPDASRNTDPVAGIDGKAAKSAYDNYRDSFRTPSAEAAAPLSTNSISSGGK
jgi:hypothetical protein